MIWQAVLENVQSDSLRRMMAKEGRIISVSLGTGIISSYPISVCIIGYTMPRFPLQNMPK
jgi:hypothetical protein